MKPKKMIALAALIFALCGCGTSTAASEDNVQSSFGLDWIDSNGVFDLYQDRETGVQIIKCFAFVVFILQNSDCFFPCHG